MGSSEQCELAAPSSDERLEAFWEAASKAAYDVELRSIPSAAAVLATHGAVRIELLLQCVTLFKRSVGLETAYTAHRLLSELFRNLATQEALALGPEHLAVLARADGRPNWGGPPVGWARIGAI